MSSHNGQNTEVLDKLARSQQRLCRLEAEMALNKKLMVIVTVLAVGIVLCNRCR